MLHFKRLVSAQDVALFCRQLAQLLKQGVHLPIALRLVGDMDKRKWGKRVEGILEALKRGDTLSDAMKAQSFPSLVTSFVSAGEDHNSLIKAIETCQTYYDRKHEMNQTLIRTLIYPLFVLIMMSISLIVMQTTILPRFADLYETLGIPLPWYTQLLLIGNDWRYHLWLFSIIGVVIAVLIPVLRPKEHPLKDSLANVLLRVPFIRNLCLLHITGVFSWQLGLLLKSGMPLLQALNVICVNWPWNASRNAIKRVRQRLTEGKSLRQSFSYEAGRYFHPFFPQQLAIGEESGIVAESLLHSAQLADEWFEQRVQTLLKLWEPLLILFIGLTLALIVLALFMPIFTIVDGL